MDCFLDLSAFPGLQHIECPNKCRCNHDSFNGLLKCHPNGSLGIPVYNSKYVTYFDSSEIIVAGSCPYFKFNISLVLPCDLPSHDELNEVMCNVWKMCARQSACSQQL